MTQKITQKKIVDTIKDLGIKITDKDARALAQHLSKTYTITEAGAEDLLASPRHYITMNTIWHRIDNPEETVFIGAVISGTERDPQRGMTVTIPQQVLIHHRNPDDPKNMALESKRYDTCGEYINAHEFIRDYAPGIRVRG